MKKLTTLALALGLLTAACKKEEKKSEEKATGTPAAQKEDPAPAKADTPAKADPAPADQGAATGAPAAAPPAPAAGEVTIPWNGPTAGQKGEGREQMTMKLEFAAPGKPPVQMDMVQEKVQHVEIVEVADKVPTKIKVHYETDKETRSMMGKSEDVPSPIHGKAYVVWVEGGAVKATDDKGGAVSKEEMEELEEEWADSLGKLPGAAKVITGRSWKVGEKVTLSPEELKTFSEGEKEVKAKQAEITLVGVDGDLATFEVDLVAVMEKDGDQMNMPSKMTMKLDTKLSRPVETTMKGRVEGTVKGMKTTGTLEGKDVSTWK